MALHDQGVLPELAKRYLDICNHPDQERRRQFWRRHNSLQGDRPPVHVYAFAWQEMSESHLLCEAPTLRRVENWLRSQLFREHFGDDMVFEPWLTLRASHRCTGWGPSIGRNYSEEPRGSWKIDYPLKDPDDAEQLREPWHEIDEEQTTRELTTLQDAIGDIITIAVDRGPAYRVWSGDIATDLGYLRGIEHFMLDMLDRPEWLHRLLAFLRDGILRTHEQAEAAGDWRSCAQYTQAMPYSLELPDPSPLAQPVRREHLWGYMAAQEYTAVSPAMHDEFLLQYQLPILRHFGLVGYGCCEDLTPKIDMLRQIPNLRRIAVSPFADVARCAGQIGGDYVLSYRPSPADMVGYGFDPERIRSIVGRDLRACRQHGCHTEIILKDVETVQGDPERVRNWVRLVRQIIDEIYG